MMFVSDIVFFFFKQKTAYEMRISDWSSNVCSSDLDDHGCRAIGRDDHRATRGVVRQGMTERGMTGQAIEAPSGGFHGPVKTPVTLAGHQTSISLQPPFLAALDPAAVSRALLLHALLPAHHDPRFVSPAPPYRAHPTPIMPFPACPSRA